MSVAVIMGGAKREMTSWKIDPGGARTAISGAQSAFASMGADNRTEAAIGEGTTACDNADIGSGLDALLANILVPLAVSAVTGANHVCESGLAAVDAYERGDLQMAADAQHAAGSVPEPESAGNGAAAERAAESPASAPRGPMTPVPLA